MTGHRRPRAFTLTETLVVFLLAVLVFGSLYLILTRSSTSYEEASEETQLLVGVRALLEHVARDVAAGHTLEGTDDFTRTLVVVRYRPDDPARRLDVNPEAVYPFSDPDQPTAPTKLPSVRVTYARGQQPGQIVRDEHTGVLESRSTAQRTQQISSERFTGAQLKESRVVATSVARFELTYLYFDEEDKLRPKVAGKDQVRKAACVAVHLLAAKQTGLYRDAPGAPRSRRKPQVEIATKFWLMRRLSELVHPEYFSSVDDSKRF